jgi:hypothetical protein
MGIALVYDTGDFVAVSAASETLLLTPLMLHQRFPDTADFFLFYISRQISNLILKNKG